MAYGARFRVPGARFQVRVPRSRFAARMLPEPRNRRTWNLEPEPGTRNPEPRNPGNLPSAAPDSLPRLMIASLRRSEHLPSATQVYVQWVVKATASAISDLM